MKIVILGSTGSIGQQALEVVRGLKDVEIAALTANSNLDLLEAQIAEFKPSLAVVYDKYGALALKRRLSAASGTEVLGGMEGLAAAAAMPDAKLVVNALVGNVGLLPTIAAIQAGKDVALANKEVLVCAGEVIMPMAAAGGVRILPVDSEHSAIFQCLEGRGGELSRIYLTASGGPFRDYSPEQMASITLADALSHPNWVMGRKITIDSATMMNKGLEVVEARWLFGLPGPKISVLVHPQSIVHSMVEFVDGQILAQLGPPDMRLPIQYAITYPKRRANSFGKLDFAKTPLLAFEQPDYEKFPCLKLAFEVLRAGGLMPTVLNAANEVAVELFLAEKIRFTDIARIIDKTISAYRGNQAVDIENILGVEQWAKDFAGKEGLR